MQQDDDKLRRRRVVTDIPLIGSAHNIGQAVVGMALSWADTEICDLGT